MMATPPGLQNERAQRDAAIEAALQQAKFAIQNDHPVEAERLASEILKIKPGHPEATKSLGYALIMLGRAGDAAVALEKVARGSHDPELETQFAIALRQTGQSEKALVWLKRAVKRMPPFPAAFLELGFVLNSMRRHDEAITVLEQGIAAAPLTTELAVQLGYVHYGINDRAKAAMLFKRVLGINPAHAEAIHGLGLVLMDQREFEQAAELFRRAVIANPSDAQARIGLGNCLLNLGQADAAYACLRAASAKGPEFYGKALKMSVASGHGRFWLRPSAAAEFFKAEKPKAEIG
jgi:tetratricopeptide (TPR) repeat protein